MAVKMRLMRMGKKRSAYYRVVVMDGRAPRDGKYIDLIGRYNPNTDPSLVEIDDDKAVDWLKKGAQPTEAVSKLLEITGAMSKFKVASGKIHTVATKAASAPTPTEAEVAEAAAEEVEAEVTDSDAAEDPAAAEEE